MITTVDLFAGCGGLTEGFKQTNQYEMLAAVEWDKDACNTLRHRLTSRYRYTDAEKRCILFDIQKTSCLIDGAEEIPRSLSELVKPRGLDVVIGGPPCQAYSVAGRIRDANGMHDDYRNYLFESYIKVVERFKPKACIFENVPGMLSAAPGGVSIVDRVTAAFEKIGYCVSNDLKGQALFDVSQFGVPQKRKRIIIAAFRKDAFSDSKAVLARFYEHLNQEKETKVKTVKDALHDLPKIVPLDAPSKGSSHALIDNTIVGLLDHEPRYHNDRDVKIFKTLARDIETGECKYTSSEALKELYTQMTGKTSSVHKYYVLRNELPSNTIPAHLYKDGLRHIHPDSEQARSITVREAARLQSFPDDFEFSGPNGSKYKMIGNAVPPTFARKIGKALYRALGNEN
ncbi:DNA cytosine methyltransferase [Pseudomonadales bacterium]|nr:DNA cytosine methyltransferase [Pseudomonadales bacterium]